MPESRPEVMPDRKSFLLRMDPALWKELEAWAQQELLYFDNKGRFRIDNSMILWGIALVIAMMMRSRVAIALCGAAMLHLVLDFGLHHDDGRAHFWPISDWIFQSPVSYWDPAHYGNWVGPIEIVLALAACAWKWRRYTGWRMRSLIATLGTLQLMPVIMFTLMFS